MGCYYLFFYFCVVSAGISYLRILTKNCVVGTQNACRLAGLNACVQQFIRKEKRGVPPAVPHPLTPPQTNRPFKHAIFAKMSRSEERRVGKSADLGRRLII